MNYLVLWTSSVESYITRAARLSHLPLRPIYRIKHGVVGLLDHVASDICALTSRLLQILHFFTLRWSLVLVTDWIVCCRTIAFLAKFVLFAHAFKLVILRTVLVLHELPSFDVSLHLLMSARFKFLLFYFALLCACVSVVRGKVFLVSVHRGSEMAGRGVWIVEFGVVYEFVVRSDVLSSSELA